MESHNHPSAVEPFQGAATASGNKNEDTLAWEPHSLPLRTEQRTDIAGVRTEIVNLDTRLSTQIAEVRRRQARHQTRGGDAPGSRRHIAGGGTTQTTEGASLGVKDHELVHGPWSADRPDMIRACNNMAWLQRLQLPRFELFAGSVVVESPADSGLLTRRYTYRAIEFLKRSRDGPFFLYLAYTMPYILLAASTEFTGRSLGAAVDHHRHLPRRHAGTKARRHRRYRPVAILHVLQRLYI